MEHVGEGEGLENGNNRHALGRGDPFYLGVWIPNRRPLARSSNRISVQLFRIQSAPASFRANARTVVVNAITLARADFPARTPAGTSSSTMHSSAENPRTEAPFR